MKGKYAMVAMMAVMALVCVMPAADALSIDDQPTGTIEIDDNQSVTITFTVTPDSTGTMDIVVRDGGSSGRIVGEFQRDVTAGTPRELSVSVGGLSIGTHSLRVECTDTGSGDTQAFNVTVVVDQSILGNWVTYAVIAVVAIVIVIFVYLKMRDTPKSKPEMTFEELEAQRKAEMAQKAEKKQKKPAKASSTERKRYTGRSEPKAEAPAKSEGLREAPAEKPKKEEKPKMTFEELEAQKKAEKAAKAEKKSSGKSERERYLEEKRRKEKKEE